MDEARHSDSVPLLFIDGTRVRTSPFWAATERAGCQSYDIYNHMYIPGSRFVILPTTSIVTGTPSNSWGRSSFQMTAPIRCFSSVSLFN